MTLATTPLVDLKLPNLLDRVKCSMPSPRPVRAEPEAARAGFPNMFLLYGPNTFGGSGSAVYMLESQMRHLAAAVGEMRRFGAATIEFRPEAHAAFMAELRERQCKPVWSTSGCSSWYVDELGRDPTNWPGYTFEYRRRVAAIDPEVYALDETP